MTKASRSLVVLAGLAVAATLAGGTTYVVRATPASSPESAGGKVVSNPLLPPAADDPRGEDIKTVAAAGLRSYRESLPEWQATFLVTEKTTDALRDWANATGFGKPKASVCKKVFAARSGGKWRVDVSYQNDSGQTTDTVSHSWDGCQHRFLQTSSDGTPQGIIESTPTSVLQDDLRTVESLLTSADLDSFDLDSAYYAGISTVSGRKAECYVKSSEYGWTAVWLDPERGYMPVRVLRGNHDLQGAAVTSYSDARQDESGRWTAYTRERHIRVPNETKIGKTITVRVLSFGRDVSDDAFAGPKFPKGTQVWDREKGTQYVVGADS